MIKGVHHIAIGVPDIEAGLVFYCDILGFDLDWRSDILADNEKAGAAVGLPGFEAKMAMLKGSNLCLELWQYSNPEPRDLRSDPSDLGYPHMALAVEDIESRICSALGSGDDICWAARRFRDAKSDLWPGSVWQYHRVAGRIIAFTQLS